MPDLQLVLAVGIFLLTYALVVTEKIHRAVAALLGASLVIFLGIIDQDRAIASIDFNTIGLLIGMMIIVGITRQTGVFEYMAILAARLVRGRPAPLMVALALVTAVLSAFLDNVTAVFLVVPVTFAITSKLQLSPLPFLIAEIIASNIGGTATLIGDPPNIMISGPAGLGFVDFIVNLAPIALVALFISLAVLYAVFGRRMQVERQLQEKVAAMEAREFLRKPVLLWQSLTVLGLTITGFLLHQFVHLPTAAIALGGATLLLLISREEPDKVLAEVEWPTLFFFGGLFVIVGALEEVGVIEAVAGLTLDLTGGALLPTGLLILWVSAIASALVDNIPFVAAMIPLLQEIGRIGGDTELVPLWWSLALGACLGGNGTLVGAAANVIVAGLAEKHGRPLPFLEYLKIGLPITLLSVILATLYLMAFYLR